MSSNNGQLSFTDLVAAAERCDELRQTGPLQAFGGKRAYVRPMNADTAVKATVLMRSGDTPRALASQVATCIVDSDGQRLISDEQIDMLLRLPKEAFDELAESIDRPVSVEEAEGN